MTNAGPTSTDSTTERAEIAEGQSLVAVSEENLAALLRATSNPPEPEVRQPEVQQPDEAPPIETAVEVDDAAAVAEPVASAPVEVERVVTPEPAPVPVPAPEREYPAASLPPEAAPIQVTLPKSQPVMAAMPAPMPAHMPAPSRNGWVAGAIGGALILVVGLFFLWPKGHPAKAPAAAVAAPKDNAPLQVLAEPLGNGLINVRWNAQSTTIAQARDGRLVITEHDKTPRTMALDAGQLRIGHLTYPSTAESIQFDLEVNNSSGGVAKESILAMVPPANAAAPNPREAVATVKPQAIAPTVPPKTQAPPPPPVQAVVEVPQASPVKARTFVPPSTQQNREQGAIIDAPPALASSPATPVGVNLSASLGAISPPTAAAPQPVRVESNLQAANLIKKVVPVYPLLAKSAGVEGMVRFTALIGKDGKMRNLKFISGPSPLVEAASDAVKRWVYRPTLLNGQPVEVITEINVNFTITGTTR